MGKTAQRDRARHRLSLAEYARFPEERGWWLWDNKWLFVNAGPVQTCDQPTDAEIQGWSLVA